MAKRNEVRSLFGRLNSGNPRCREDIAFGDLIFCDQIKRFWLELDSSACNGSSLTERLRRDIHHLRATIGVDVSEFLHKENSPANCNHLAIGLVIVSKIVFPRLSFDNVEKKMLELFIARAPPHRSHDVKLQIAAKTRA